MEEKKWAALLKATQKLVDKKVSDEYILLSLQDLGVSEDDSKNLLNTIKPVQNEAQEEPQKPQKNDEEHKFEDAWKAVLDKKIDQKDLVQAVTSKPSAEQKSQDYIQQIKGAGKGKVKEIIVDSPIGKGQWKNSKKQEEEELSQDPEKLIIYKLSKMEHKIEELERAIMGKKKKRGR